MLMVEGVVLIRISETIRSYISVHQIAREANVKRWEGRLVNFTVVDKMCGPSGGDRTTRDFYTVLTSP